MQLTKYRRDMSCVSLFILCSMLLKLNVAEHHGVPTPLPNPLYFSSHSSCNWFNPQSEPHPLWALEEFSRFSFLSFICHSPSPSHCVSKAAKRYSFLGGSHHCPLVIDSVQRLSEQQRSLLPRISRLPLHPKELRKGLKKWNPSPPCRFSPLKPIHALCLAALPSRIRILVDTPRSFGTLRLQAGARPTFQPGPDRPPPTSKPRSLKPSHLKAPGAPGRPPGPAQHPRRNGTSVPRGHLHPAAAVGRCLLGARPLAQAGLGSVSSPSGHWQLQLRLPLHPPGSGAGPELRWLLRLGAFRHPPAPPSPPGAGRPATGHLPPGPRPRQSRQAGARLPPPPRACVRARARARRPSATGGRRSSLAGFSAPSGWRVAKGTRSRPHAHTRPLAQPAARPASHTHGARPPARARSLTLSLTTRWAEGGRGRSGLPRRGEGCLFGGRRGSRQERADWPGSSDPPLWQHREGGERERRREGPGSGTPARAGGCGGGGGGRARGGGGPSAPRRSPLPALRAPEGGQGEIGKVRKSPAPARECLGGSARTEFQPAWRGRSMFSLRAGPQPWVGGA